MEIVTEIGLKGWQLSIVSAALVIASIISIWRNLHLGKVLKIVIGEMTPNGGGSIKDKVDKGDRQNQKIISDVATLSDRVDSVRSDHVEIKTRLEKLEQLEYRKIDHDARNDLHASALAAEARKLLRK